MKKPSKHLIAEVPRSVAKARMTIGIDLGDVWSHYCTLNEDGEVAQLDRVTNLEVRPEVNPVLGVQSSWDRTNLMETARKEIDTMVNLDHLLESTKEPILDLAPTPGEETIMRLGPDVTAQIKHKIHTMNAHWRDYDRLFTVPNP